MAKTSPETIEKINILWRQLGVKSQVAKALGISPATVTKYIDPDWEPTETAPAFDDCEFNISLDLSKWEGDINSINEYCTFTEEEKEGIKEIQKGLLV